LIRPFALLYNNKEEEHIKHFCISVVQVIFLKKIDDPCQPYAAKFDFILFECLVILLLWITHVFADILAGTFLVWSEARQLDSMSWSRTAI